MAFAIVFENTAYGPTLSLRVKGTGAVVALPGTYEVTFWKAGATSAFITATLANGKIASVNSGAGQMVLAIPAADLASIGDSFGTLQIKRTDAGPFVVASPRDRRRLPDQPALRAAGHATACRL